MNDQDIGLTEQNFLIFAARFYDNVFYDTVEFQEDLKRFVYLKRLFNQYKKNGELKERLILNHLVIIFNMWSAAAVPMLFVKLKGYEPILKTFLTFLGRMPETIPGIGLERRTIINYDIESDEFIMEYLKNNV